jgi:hypothetical protein
VSEEFFVLIILISPYISRRSDDYTGPENDDLPHLNQGGTQDATSLSGSNQNRHLAGRTFETLKAINEAEALVERTRQPCFSASWQGS